MEKSTKKNNTEDYLNKFSKLDEVYKVKFESITEKITSSIKTAKNEEEMATCILSVILDLLHEQSKLDSMYDDLKIDYNSERRFD